MLPTLLIVDDEAAARFALKRAFAPQYNVLEADSVAAARPLILQQAPPVILLDYTMPGEDGLALLKEYAGRAESPAIIMITAFGSEKVAVEAMKLGAFDYLPKPYDLEELRVVTARAFEHQQLRAEVEDLRRRVTGEAQFGRMTGDSPLMREIFVMAERVAQSDLPILVLGESGTGKDLLAQEIHARSPRARQRFVALNCAALPEALVESELFGFEKGAFTGALSARAGKFELASGGTLFLDEIGDMTAATQAKILRAAESGVIERLGGSRPIHVDVRVVSATNQDLQQAISAGRFRQDLYYRLAGMVLLLPPLRQRREDIPLLVERFWRELARKYTRDAPELTPAAFQHLSRESWPGNVRQLRSTVERLFVLAGRQPLGASEVAAAMDPSPPANSNAEPCFGENDYRAARRLFEAEFLSRKLREHGGNVTRTAAAIGIERQSLQEKIRQLGVTRD
ncbi:MAG: sigma-54-dependent Fis family transcriptional regulator [Candidatus Solibacter usitatus]|nr:sigma-54-dependent Fis family transcriptional regulator [Candidatus Solibacter usitatus]